MARSRDGNAPGLAIWGLPTRAHKKARRACTGRANDGGEPARRQGGGYGLTVVALAGIRTLAPSGVTASTPGCITIGFLAMAWLATWYAAAWPLFTTADT